MYNYKVKGSHNLIMELKDILWQQGKIQSNVSQHGIIFISIRDTGELSLLQDACYELGLDYEHA